MQFRAPKLEMHEAVLAAAQQHQRGGVFSFEDETQPEREWRVVDSAFAYVGSEPWGVHHHTWRLAQVSRLAVSALRLGDLSLVPYDYREEVTELGVLRVAARAPVDAAALAELGRLVLTRVQVLREGISDEPVSMLLEGYVWGPSAEHGQAVAVVLSSEPRVTLAGATPTSDQATRQVKDLDAWAL